MKWILDLTPAALAEENMDSDYARLEALSSTDAPILRIYRWKERAATYGYFSKPEGVLREGHGLDLAKRPTGGGLLFHTEDLAFSVIIPFSHPAVSRNTLANYAFVNGCVADALKKIHPLPYQFLTAGAARSSFCMAEPTQYDIMVGGKKMVGAAQRLTKQGLLHQGSIALRPIPRVHLERWLQDPTLADTMESNSCFLLGPGEEKTRREDVIHELIASFRSDLYNQHTR